MKKLIITLMGIVLIGAGCTTATSNNKSNQRNPDSAKKSAQIKGKQADADKKEPKREKVLDMLFQDYSGNDVALADFTGKPIVVNSWAIWCPFCVKELPDFAQAQKEFGDKVVIVAINRKEPQSRTEKYLAERGVRNDLVFWLDPKDKFYSAIGGFSMPETLFISATGEILEHKRGVMEADEIRQKIKTNFGI